MGPVLQFARAPIQRIVAAELPRSVKAKALAEFIRTLRSYRWVGIYDVGPESVSVIAWSGPEAPAYAVFPVTRGLTASAIREKKASLSVTCERTRATSPRWGILSQR
jgi:putative methionine-R-sulfoxide reductase with GAF domain